jgi:hypothetical protein
MGLCRRGVGGSCGNQLSRLNISPAEEKDRCCLPKCEPSNIRFQNGILNVVHHLVHTYVKSHRSSARAGPPGPAFTIGNSPLLELGRKVWLVAHPLAPMRDLDLEKDPRAAPLVAQGRVTMLTQTLELAATDYNGGGQCEGTCSHSGRLVVCP